jgi:hypothetical protein
MSRTPAGTIAGDDRRPDRAPELAEAGIDLNTLALADVQLPAAREPVDPGVAVDLDLGGASQQVVQRHSRVGDVHAHGGEFHHRRAGDAHRAAEPAGMSGIGRTPGRATP